MKIYTKTGDDGTTGLLGSGRLSKDHARIAAYGTVDELNAALGVARAMGPDANSDSLLSQLQDELFAAGAALADPNPAGRFYNALTSEHVTRLEETIDALEAELPPLHHFVLPTGAPPAAQLHLARTICRRAERAVVHLTREPGQQVAPALVVYLNRMSDLLFVLARVVNQRAGVADVPWRGT